MLLGSKARAPMGAPAQGQNLGSKIYGVPLCYDHDYDLKRRSGTLYILVGSISDLNSINVSSG